MPRKKEEPIRRLIVPKNATMRQIYAAARKAFTAADLQKFTEIEPMVPAEQVLAEMEEIDRKISSKKKRK
jgi:hypothetical protein